MPIYEYVCNDCHTAFEAVLTLNEHDTEQVTCPKCNSRNVQQDVADFYAVTSKKS